MLGVTRIKRRIKEVTLLFHHINPWFPHILKIAQNSVGPTQKDYCKTRKDLPKGNKDDQVMARYRTQQRTIQSFVMKRKNKD